MDAGTVGKVRTRVEPWELVRYGRPARTQIRPEDLDPYAAAVNTRVRPEDLDKSIGVRTVLSPGEATGEAVARRVLSPEEQHKELTKNAEKLVAQTFFGTMLKQMRESPFKSELFSGGRGGETFQAMHDQYLAERMAHGAGRRLAGSIVKHIEDNLRKKDGQTGGSEAGTNGQDTNLQDAKQALATKLPTARTTPPIARTER